MTDAPELRERLADAERLLARMGHPDVALDADGPDAEILVLRPRDEDAVARIDRAGSALTAPLRALGFRYVAVDLDPPA